MATIAAGDDDFRTKVLESKLPVLVDFWAAWCAPCRQVAPVLEDLSEAFEGRLQVVKVDVDRAPMVAQTYRVQSIPTLMIFKDGTPIQAAQGALPKDVLEKFIEQTLPEFAPPSIEVKDLVQRMASGNVTVVDLRPKNDFSRGHILGSIQADPEDWTDHLSKENLLVLVDRDGRTATDLARDTEGVVALSGGILEWQITGQPTYSDDEEAKLRS
ncbi:MAG: thioredoxin [Myxococcota bacterium]